MNIDRFTRAYMLAALWSSTDDAGNPLDDARDISDIATETVKAMRADCEAFMRDNAADLERYAEQMADGSGMAGHDFWLTRCGHGSGFWDRGLGGLGERLSCAANAYGAVDLYVGDDGKIYA